MTERAGIVARARALLDPEARRAMVSVALVSCLSAGISAAMIASLMPFLEVLADPAAIDRSHALTTLQERLEQGGGPDILILLGGISIVLVIAAGVLKVLTTTMLTRFSARQIRGLSRMLYSTYLHRPYTFHITRNSADLSANMLSEAEAAVRRAYRPAAQLGSALLTTSAVVVVLMTIDVVVTMAALVLIGGLYGVIFMLARLRLRRLGELRTEANKRLYQAAAEGLQGIKEVIILGREAYYTDRFDSASREVQEATMQVQVLAEIPRYLIQTLILSAVILFCLIYVTGSNMEGQSRASGLIPLIGVFAAAGQRLLPELQWIYASLSTLQFGIASIDRLYDDLSDQPPRTRIRSELIRLTRDLRLEALSFVYPAADLPAVHNVDLTIRAGDRLGIAGRSGAGKTTLGDVLLGLLPPTSGRLLIDGVEITGDAVAGWQTRVGYVPQDIFLADATVAENIAFGLPEGRIDRERVIECATTAQLDGLISALPEGLDTCIGERGIRISGGQRQRIAIARAIYRGVDLLVFDEATSALDTLTEHDVMAALDCLPGDMTVVLIAHRLSTLAMCDRIVVMEAGRVVAHGSAAQLRISETFRELMSR